MITKISDEAESSIQPLTHSLKNPEWTHLIPSEDWVHFKRALRKIQKAKIPIVLGGAFGLASYTGRLRNTKDLDLLILPAHRKEAIHCLSEIGFDDFFEKKPYERHWIYRSYHENLIIDLIWGMANRRADVDESWFEGCATLQIREETIHVLPVEYIFWMKLYVLQRDRSDWLDLINLLYASIDHFNWELLLEKVDEDLPLLSAITQIFSWICPEKAEHIPQSIYAKLGIRHSINKNKKEKHILSRIRLLDTRPWFAALQSKDQLLKV
jgi:hypothetical protein